MNSSIIGKIEKAKRYAAEPERVKIHSLDATFHGGHDEYTITLKDGRWHCSCHFFESQDYGTCSHIMAMERLLNPMLPRPAESEPLSHSGAPATSMPG